MNYQKIYDRFIEDRRQHPTGEIRAEIHHIIPISAGGDVGEANCIRLSIRDHIFAHKVLRRLGLDPTGPTSKKMSRAIAAEIYARMAGQPVSAYGRGKQVVSYKTLTKTMKQKEAEIVRLGNEMVDRFMELIEPGLDKYEISITRGKKFNSRFTKFFTELIPCIKITRLDRAAGDNPQETPGEPRELPEEPGKFDGKAEEYSDWAETHKIFLTFDGQAKMSFMPTKISRKFLDSNEWHDLLFRWINPALDRLLADVKRDSGKMHPDGATICRSDNEFNMFRMQAAIFGFCKVTGMKPGTYRIEDIVGWSCQGIQMLLLQHTALHHMRHLRDVDIVDIYDNALVARLQGLPEKFANPVDYDERYLCLSKQVLRRSLGCVAFTEKRRDELMDMAVDGAWKVRNNLVDRIRQLRNDGFSRNDVEDWKIVARFIAAAGYDAVRDYIEKGGIAA